MSAVAGSAASPRAERISYAAIQSKALGRTLPLAVIKPAGGEPTDDAVVYLLHGRGRNHRSLIDSAGRAALLAAPFHIVMPQGEDGWYIDSPARSADRYGAYLEEVVAWAEKNLGISSSPKRRGITGWSMGAYGAVRCAETHPGKFGFVASIIGLLDFPRPETLPEGQNYRVPAERFTSDPRVWKQFNPLAASGRLRGSAVTLVLATQGFERTMNENFIVALNAQDIVARVHWFQGGHEFPLVVRALPTVIADAAEYFGGSSSHQ